MASFQVEIASSSTTFGCVIRNHSRRDRCSSGGSNSFPELTDLMHSCISGDSRKSNADSDGNVIDITDLWVHKPQYLGNNNNQSNEEKSQKQSTGKSSENWDKARKKMLSAANKEEENEGLAGDSAAAAPRVVSSLVKKWKDFAAEKKPPANNNNSNSSACSSRSNSTATIAPPESVDIPAAAAPPPLPAVSVAGDESSDGTDDDSSFVDWENDRRVMSAPPSIRGRDSDVTESERVRVIDIIKKLTSSGGGGDENHDNNSLAMSEAAAPPLPKVKTKKLTSSGGGSDENHDNNSVAMSEAAAAPLPKVKTSAEQGCVCPHLNSPSIIKSRKAFRHLLVQMERERARELEGLSGRKAVSKFQQKGRIQAMLKLKFLRREAEVKDSAPHRCISPESIKLTQSSIMSLREKFKTGAQQGVAESKATTKEAQETNNTEVLPKPVVSTSKRKKDSHHQETTCQNKEAEKPNTSTTTTNNISTSKKLQEEKRRPQTEVVEIKPEQIKVCVNCQQTKTTSNIQKIISPKESSRKEERLQIVIPEVRLNNELTESAETTKPVSKSGSDKEQSSEWTRDWEENDWGWINDYSHPQSGWDQLQFDFQQEDFQKRVYDEVSQDWITDVSRPRSEWEDLRQARYQEMLDPYFNNGDLQQLLQRKSVSSFLSGGMRDKIDQLMICRSQKQSTLTDHQIQKQVTGKKGEKMEERARQRGRGVKTYQDEEEDGDGNESNQTWSHNQECDMRDDYDQITSTALPQFQSSSFFSQVNEMKLIHELMGHMEQLHQEMSEIRRAIISCLDMQMKLQHSIKDEVASAFNQLGNENGKVSSNNECKSKRNCSICHEMLVDALLYRCGHMCTCFKCAQELQWGEGICPVCQAPIVDVVRACADA